MQSINFQIYAGNGEKRRVYNRLSLFKTILIFGLINKQGFIFFLVIYLQTYAMLKFEDL